MMPIATPRTLKTRPFQPFVLGFAVLALLLALPATVTVADEPNGAEATPATGNDEPTDTTETGDREEPEPAEVPASPEEPGSLAESDEPTPDAVEESADEESTHPDDEPAEAEAGARHEIDELLDALMGGRDAILQELTETSPSIIARIDFHLVEDGEPVEAPYIRRFLERFGEAFESVEGIDLDLEESWRAYNRPAGELRDGLPRQVRFALVGEATFELQTIGRLILVEGTYTLRLVDMANRFAVHEFTVPADEEIAASGRRQEDALDRLIESIAGRIAPESAAQLEAYLAEVEDPWYDPELPSRDDLEEFFERGRAHGHQQGLGEGFSRGFGEGQASVPPLIEEEPTPLGLLLDIQAGGEFILGHSRTDLIPQMPDDRFKYVTRAHGTPTLALNLQFSFEHLFGVDAPGVWAGLEGVFGIGEYVRFWQAGVVATQRLHFAPLYLDISLSLGAMQLSAGSDDISDVAYYILTEEHGVDEDVAFEEAFNHRIHSPVLLYASLRPRLGLQVSESFDLFLQMNVLFAPATDRFTLAGRDWGGTDEPSMPAFDWGTIGFGLVLGTSIRF